MRYDRTQERDVENIFNFKTEFDKKSKLLLSDKKIPQILIDAIEKGDITSEVLETLDFPIRKYMTQITIHGDFDNFNQGYGYKFVFKNKNGSVGVKWQAIDWKKRKYIASYLKESGIYYFSNSTESYFCKNVAIDKDNYQSALEDLKELVETAKSAEYYGGAKIYRCSVYGQQYLVFQMVINGISESNVEKLLSAFGYDKDMRAKVDAERLAKEEATKKEREERWANQKANKEKLLQELKIELEENGYSKDDVEKFENEAIYFQARMNWNNEKEFKLVKRYKKNPRARCYHVVEKEFKSFKEMNEWLKENELEPTIWDRKLKQNSISKGFRIKGSEKEVPVEKVENSDVKVVENKEKNGIELYFTNIPDETCRNQMKKNNWKWSRYNKCWYNRNTEENMKFAKCL